jgi:hypothetical protein
MIKEMFSKEQSVIGILGWCITYTVISFAAYVVSIVKNTNLTLVPAVLMLTVTIMITSYYLELKK